jgi:hypothetical protein
MWEFHKCMYKSQDKTENWSRFSMDNFTMIKYQNGHTTQWENNSGNIIGLHVLWCPKCNDFMFFGNYVKLHTT